MAIKVAVICGSELGVACEFAGEQTTGQWNAYDNADIALASCGEELLRRFESEHVEDDLNGLHIGVANGFKGLFNFFNADPVMAYFALLDQVIQDGEHFWPIVDFSRWAMQL